MKQCKVVEIICCLHLQREGGNNFLTNRVSTYLNKWLYILENEIKIFKDVRISSLKALKAYF